MTSARRNAPAPRPVYTRCPVADCQDAECEHASPAPACSACGAQLGSDEATVARLDHKHPPKCDDCFWRWVELAELDIQLVKDLASYCELRAADVAPEVALRAVVGGR